MEGPTQQQLALVKFAEDCEASGFKPAHYYRLTTQIEEARAAVAEAARKAAK